MDIGIVQVGGRRIYDFQFEEAEVSSSELYS